MTTFAFLGRGTTQYPVPITPSPQWGGGVSALPITKDNLHLYWTVSIIAAEFKETV